MQVTENVSLKNVTTFRTGGVASFFITADLTEILDAFQFAISHALPLIPIGSGSNMLAPDQGVNAVFLKITSNTIQNTQQGEEVLVSADAGVLWDDLVAYVVERGWWGIENLTSIPGTVGAAVVQNIGAYGAVMSDSVTAVDVFDSRTSTLVTLQNHECLFGYRTSLFKKEVDRYIVTRVHFALSPNPRARLEYRDLAEYFSGRNGQVSLAEIRSAVASIRSKKFPPLAEYGTAGSFFLNPVLTKDEAERVQAQFKNMPLFPMPEGGVKVPLAWILDHVLFLKGHRIQNAFLWPAQPLVIATESDATSRDVIALAKYVQTLVKEKTDIDISPEVRIFQ